MSLQTRVAVACAAVAVLVIGAMAAVFLAVVRADTGRQLDRIAQSLQVTSDDASGHDGKVTMEVPASLVDEVIEQKTHRIIGVAGLAVVLAGGLGRLVARRAVLPMRQLTAATRNAGSTLHVAVSPRGGTTETAELAAAMNEMLDRIADERRNTVEALAAARDFAATSAHELRTPLTSMRTDLEVLAELPLPEADRTEILAEILHSQHAVESTLTALEQLAQGELITESDWEDVDLDELLDQVAADANRAHPGTAVASLLTEPRRLHGLGAGVRLIVENAVTNSIRHGGATRVDIDAHATTDAGVLLTVDDNGTGIPDADRERVFRRFVRGATEAPGTGLGLALVVQQARLHNGGVRFADSPLGGARLEVTLGTGPNSRN